MSSGSPSFAGLRRAADQIKGSQLPSYSTATTSLSKRRVLALRACLDAEPDRLQASPDSDQSPEDAAAKRQIRQFVTAVLSPTIVRDEAAGDDDDDDLTHGDDLAGRRDKAVRRCRAYASSGIAVLERVGLPSIESPRGKMHEAADGDDAQVFYTLTALADAAQPWTTEAAADSAQRLLASAFGGAQSSPAKSLWIVDGILKQYLRPLFARSRPATITESGRKTEYSSGARAGAAAGSANHESPRNKPWKYVDLRAVSVAAWAVHEADGDLIRGNWPLFIPVLLALIDDPDTAVRARGLTLLRTFVDAAPRQRGPDGGASLLHTTGLDSVLADAVFPTLLYLPRLTPESESLQLLGPAYAALLSLASAAATESKAAPGPGGRARLSSKAAADLLDRILRDGIYTGYLHANEHIRIVEELLRQAGNVVQAMGIYAVKHLKDLMPLYAGVMTDPFAMRYLPAVVASVEALQTTLATCWPRLANTPWQEETLSMLMLCWLNADEDASGGAAANKDRAALQRRLAKAAATQLAIMRAANVDLQAKVGPLIAKEPRLKALFKL